MSLPTFKLQERRIALAKALDERLTIAIGHLMHIAEHGDPDGEKARKALETMEEVEPHEDELARAVAERDTFKELLAERTNLAADTGQRLNEMRRERDEALDELSHRR